MRLLLILVMGLNLTFSQLTFAAACPASTGSITAGNGTNCDVTDGNTNTVITLNFISGFDSTVLIESDTAGPSATDAFLTSFSGKTVTKAVTVAAAAAVSSKASGNNGTTVGAQRKLSFIKAAELIASQVISSETIIIDAQFSALSCSAGGGTLGSAGATNNLSSGDPADGFVLNTYYPIALFNALSGSDVDAGLADISSDFNTNVGTASCVNASNGWYYGFDDPPAEVYTADNGDPLGIISGGSPLVTSYHGFTAVLLHEITHGLGFSSGASASSGVKGFGTGKDDIFSNFLYDNATSRTWNDASETNANRAAASISNNGLLWAGTNVNTQAIGILTAGFQDNDASSSFTAGDRVQIYAPNPVEGGSSISHFDTAASPDEIMEPQYTSGALSLGLALYLLQDIGWSIVAPSNNTPPTWSTIPSQTLDIGETATIDLDNYADDVDDDPLSYSGCGATSICSISSNILTINTATVASENIVIEADDGNGGTVNSPSFTITVKVPSVLSSTFDGNPYEDGDTIIYDFTNKPISILGGSGYSYTLSYDGSDQSSLLDTSGTGVSINLPASGAFAGSYTLDITDTGNNQMSLTLVRPLRLSWSSTSILNGDTSQTLSIEGGKAGSLYSTSQQPSTDLSFLDDNGDAITTFTAPNNAATFNVATGLITGATVSAITTVAVTISNSNNGYPDALQDIKLYPKLTQQITVINESGQAIAAATLSLTSNTIVAELNLTLSYVTNAQGSVSVLLPDDNNSYTLTISASGYNSKTLNVNAQQTTHQVVLTVNENAITVSGSITALSTQNFILNKPNLNLLFEDSDAQSVTIAVNSPSKATFEFDLDESQDQPESLEILQVDSITVNKNLSNLSSSQFFQFFLEFDSNQSTQKNVKIEASSGSGYPNPLCLLLLSLLLIKRKIQWKSGIQ